MDTSLKCADPNLQLDVDSLIIDFLLNTAILAVLEDYNNQERTEWSEGTNNALNSVDSCLEVLQNKYSLDDFSETLQFRLSLLRFSTMFCGRFNRTTTAPTSDLRLLRNKHAIRAHTWREARSFEEDSFSLYDDSPLDPSHLQQCRECMLHNLAIPASDNFYGTEASVSLLDMLPLFMELSAARAQLNADFGISQLWMELAAEFMLQSALEAYLCFGANGREAMKEAFAWGFNHLSDPDLVNQMFRADTAEEAMEIDGWEEIRHEYLHLLKPSDGGSSMIDYFLKLVAERPLVDFEAKITSFLTDLSQSIEAPVLLQLDRGQLVGLSVEETHEFKRKVGLESMMMEATTSSS